MEFAEVFASLRTERKLSQRKAAEDLGISQALLSHYENGIRQPRFDFVVRACEYYGVSADYLLGITDIRHNPAGDSVETSDGAVLEMWGDDLTRELALSVGVVTSIIEHEYGTQAQHALVHYLSTQLYRTLRYFERSSGTEITHSTETDGQARALAELQLAHLLSLMQAKAPQEAPGIQAPREFSDMLARVRAQIDSLKEKLEQM